MVKQSYENIKEKQECIVICNGQNQHQNCNYIYKLGMRNNRESPIKYKFSITNLVLVNDVYPFDFFLRVRAINQQDFQDSPVIYANQMECEQVFPWEFAVNSCQLKIQFVQISRNSGVQISRAQHVVEEITDQDGEPVALLANRTNKKLCIVTYKLQVYSSPVPVRKSPKKSNEQRTRDKNEAIEQYSKSEPNKRKLILSKQQHDELSRQIANINKSIQKILDHEKSQHALFTKYLDQSTNFIKEMMNQSKQSNINANDENQNGSRIKEEGEELQNQSAEQSGSTDNILKEIQQSEENENENEEPSNSKVSATDDEMSSKKWYQQKYNKEQPQISSKKDFRKQKNSKQAGQPSLIYSNPDPNTYVDQSILILSGLIFNTEIFPKQVSFSDPKTKKQLLKMKMPGQGSYEWKKIIQIPNVPFLVVTAFDGNKKYEGCIAKEQLEKNWVNMYDEKGQQKGFLKFRHKILQIYSVQTHQMLNLASISEIRDDQQKKDEIQQNKDNEKTQDSPKNKKEQFETYKVNKQQTPSRRSSRLRKLSQQLRNNASRNSEKQQMENKEDARSPAAKSNRCDLVSNSISVSFLPFMKKQRTSSREQYHHSAHVLDSQPSQLNSSQFLSRIKLVNLKINTISIKLNRNGNINEFVGKFLKISIRNRQPIVTEIINLSQNLTWKGKGYIFDNVSPYAELKIQLCSNENNTTKVIGLAKVCLALLNLQKQNLTQFYHQYVRDEKQQEIGQLILGYQSVDKNRRSQSAQRMDNDGLNDGFNDQENQNNIHTSKQKKRRKIKSKSKTKDIKVNKIAEPTHRTEVKNSNNIGQTGSQAKSVVGCASVIRTRKYTGGNIIIGRAARFRFEKNPQEKPGPGEYEVPSYFERHVAPM